MTDTPRPQPAPWVRAVIDYLGPVAFIVGFFLAGRDLTAGAWWLVGGSAAALVFSLAMTRRIAPGPLIYGGMALVFGALTVALHDTFFLKIKPTVVYGLLGATLLGSLILTRAAPGGVLRLVMGDALVMSDRGWRVLTWRYGGFFLAMAVLNEIVRRTQSNTTWALFHMPGMLILLALFALTQLPLMMREAKAADVAAAAMSLTET